MACALCLKTNPHFDILIENGRVTSVWYISTKEYFNRELDKSDYTVLTKTALSKDNILSGIKKFFLKLSRRVALP